MGARLIPLSELGNEQKFLPFTGVKEVRQVESLKSLPGSLPQLKLALLCSAVIETTRDCDDKRLETMARSLHADVVFYEVIPVGSTEREVSQERTEKKYTPEVSVYGNSSSTTEERTSYYETTTLKKSVVSSYLLMNINFYRRLK